MPGASYITEKRRFLIENSILGLLLILSLLGIGITRFSLDDGYGYWIFMVFVFGGFAMLIGWIQAKANDAEFWDIAKDQLKHWATSLVVVVGTFLLQSSGRLDAMAAVLVILLILSLATMLDGLRIGRNFSLLGLFLNIAALVIAYTPYYIWVLSATAVGIICLTVLWDFLVSKWKEYSS